MPVSTTDKSGTSGRRRRWSAVWSAGSNTKEGAQSFEKPTETSSQDDAKRVNTNKKRRASMFGAMGLAHDAATPTTFPDADEVSVSPLRELITYYGEELVGYRKSNDLFKRILNTGQYLHIYFITFTILSMTHGRHYLLQLYPRTNSGRNMILPMTIADNGNMTEDHEVYNKHCLIRYPVDNVPNSLRISVLPQVEHVSHVDPFVEERDNSNITEEEDELLSEPPLMTDVLPLESKTNRDIPLVASSNGVLRLYLKPPFDKNHKKPVPLGILTLRMEYKSFPQTELRRSNKHNLLSKRRRSKKQEQLPDPQGFAIASNSILVERRRRRNSMQV